MTMQENMRPSGLDGCPRKARICQYGERLESSSTVGKDDEKRETANIVETQYYTREVLQSLY
jgi:hypothetical protein